MWIILLAVFLVYVVISNVITIATSESKGNKRMKSFVKMLLWLVTVVIMCYLAKANGNYMCYLMLSCFLVVKYLLKI